jgi:hypothetical protein
MNHTKKKSTKNSFNFSIIAAAYLVASSYAGKVQAYSQNSYAGRRKINSQLMPFTPRQFIDGTLASQGFLYGDSMVPVIGNTEGFAFVDGTGKWGTDKGWLGALGTGLREIWRGAIFGGYALW